VNFIDISVMMMRRYLLNFITSTKQVGSSGNASNSHLGGTQFEAQLTEVFHEFSQSFGQIPV
jgi:hypothetical protein